MANVIVDRSPKQLDALLARFLLSSDFESGSMSPWFDQSPSSVNWRVERSNPILIRTVPQPANGVTFLNLTRNANNDAGLAILKSPIFTALPGDQVNFTFWIRSRHPLGNSLQLYAAQGNNETLLIDVSQFSTSSNFEWRVSSVALPVTEPTDISLIFYGFCSNNAEDAVALDDIYIGPDDDQTTTTHQPTTTRTTDWWTTPGYTETWSPQYCLYNLPTCTSLTSYSGSFYSPNFPSNYNNYDCRCWLINAPPGYRIHLDFSSFALENGADYVHVYDGSSIYWPNILTATGSGSPAVVHSSNNRMLVTFSSDYSVTDRGFQANYAWEDSYVTPPYTSTVEETITVPYYTTWSPTLPPNPNNCIRLTAYNGQFYSPGYPYSYPNNAAVCWLITMPVSYYGVYLEFNYFDLEDCCDYVTVYDGASYSSNILLKADGSSRPYPVFSSSNYMLVTFTTDGSVVRTGFAATYTLAGNTVPDRPSTWISETPKDTE